MHPHLHGARVESHLGKTTSVHPTGMNPDLPVFGCLVQHEISALDHVDTEHEIYDQLVRTEFYDEVKTDKAMKGTSTSHFNEVI
uniref:Uncharacterized protein n=1 Tax=Timema tahoe TaxID=61484 RepID=A0A7R9IE95_9NEOP|nr:unnamed protein product [Timema tahoe]